jgi:hypothetical protein
MNIPGCFTQGQADFLCLPPTVYYLLIFSIFSGPSFIGEFTLVDTSNNSSSSSG